MQIEVREMPLAKVRIFARLCTNVRERSMRLVRGTTSYCRGTLIAATTRRATPFTTTSSSSSSATTLLLLLLRRGAAATLLLFLRRSLRLLLRPSFSFRRRFL